MLKNPDVSSVINALGGTTEVARLCRITPQAVTKWRRTGIPMARWLYLRAVRPDVVPEDPARVAA